MLRLAAIGGHEAAWQQVGRRLHRATLQWLPSEACSDLLPTACDALVLLDATDDVLGRADRYIWDGKHVLLAAPKAAQVPSLSAVLADSNASRGRLMIANPQRFNPSWQLIQQQLASGKLGEPGLVRVHHWDGRQDLAARLEPWFARRRSRKWPTILTSPLPLDGTSWLSCSTLLCELDVAVWLLGRAPDLVFASASQSATDAPLDGRYVHVHLGSSQGGMALVVYTDRVPIASSYWSLSAIGSLGAAYADDQSNVQLRYYDSGAPEATPIYQGPRERTALVQSFVDGLAAGDDFASSIAAWKTTLSLAAAVERSLKTRQAVTPEAGL